MGRLSGNMDLPIKRSLLETIFYRDLMKRLRRGKAVSFQHELSSRNIKQLCLSLKNSKDV
jgi:hypothetical protein